MRNHLVTTPQPLLDKKGCITEPGWSTKQIWEYNRLDIKANKLRIKEWDYYLVHNEQYGVAFTLSDNGYFGLQSVSFLDFITGFEHTESLISKLPMGKMHMPTSSSSGNILFRNDRVHLEFRVSKGRRQILCNFLDFYEEKPLRCNILLEQPDMDTMVIATPWHDKKHAFYYNQKINCMRANGHITFQNKHFHLNGDTTFATLDWGRGVWPYHATWYWGTGNGLVNGKPFGFNIGYGFGDTHAASENILFYEGVAHKLDDVVIDIPFPDYMAPWKITSSDGRFEMDFLPILDRTAQFKVAIVSSNQHQVFGKMTGTAILDNGEVLTLHDFICSCEHIQNKF